MINLHIYPSNLKNASRIFKITKTIADMRIFKEIILIGKNDYTMNENEIIDDSRKIWRVPLTKFPFLYWKISKTLRYIQWLLKIYFSFRKKKIMMVNCHSIFDLPVGIMLKKATGCKLIYDAHELETERNGFKGKLQKIFKLIEKMSIKHIDHIFVVCDSIEEWYKNTYNFNNLTVVKNIPIKKKLMKNSNTIKNMFSIPEEHILFIHQGMFFNGRGIHILLSTFSKIYNTSWDNVKAHIVFMGYGVLSDEIKSFESQYYNIHFLNAVLPEDVLLYTSSADVGISLIENISLSDYYCLPNKLFEYYMSGIPSIVSDFPEMRNFIDKYDLGWSTKVNEKNIFDLIQNLSKKSVLKKKNKVINSLKRDDYNWSYEKNKLVDVYNRILQDLN